jgi:hypothetical protein
MLSIIAELSSQKQKLYKSKNFLMRSPPSDFFNTDLRLSRDQCLVNVFAGHYPPATSPFLPGDNSDGADHGIFSQPKSRPRCQRALSPFYEKCSLLLLFIAERAPVKRVPVNRVPKTSRR